MLFLFFFNDTATTEIYTLSLHDALPICPELQIMGITTTFGDTETRAKLLDRFLAEVGRQEIPVAAGAPSPPKSALTQHRYAEGGHFAKPVHPDAVTFLLEQIRRYPGQITLIAIGPLMNIGSAIDKDQATFRKLKGVIIMGGSIKRGYGDLGFGPPQPPPTPRFASIPTPTPSSASISTASPRRSSRAGRTASRFLFVLR